MKRILTVIVIAGSFAVAPLPGSSNIGECKALDGKATSVMGHCGECTTPGNFPGRWVAKQFCAACS